MADIPRWKLDGDWFDVCKCNIPCPCEFAQTRAGAKASMAMFIDERANAKQREALQTIFGGQAGGWPGQFAQNIAEVRGMEFAPIEFEVAGDLATWRAAIPGKVEAKAEALTGPTTSPGQRVQTINPPGSEIDPGANVVATWGTATVDRADAFGFKWNRSGQSSKHIPFSWNGARLIAFT
jgi:hypothetical protein